MESVFILAISLALTNLLGAPLFQGIVPIKIREIVQGMLPLNVEINWFSNAGVPSRVANERILLVTRYREFIFLGCVVEHVGLRRTVRAPIQKPRGHDSGDGKSKNFFHLVSLLSLRDAC